MTLWKITGQVVAEPEDTRLVVHATTPDPLGLPDPDAALGRAKPWAAWSKIDRVERLGEVPTPSGPLGHVLDEAILAVLLRCEP